MFWGVFQSFRSGLKLSKVFTFKKAQKVLESKKRENEDSWDLCSHYLYSLFGQQDEASPLSADSTGVASYDLVM